MIVMINKTTVFAAPDANIIQEQASLKPVQIIDHRSGVHSIVENLLSLFENEQVTSTPRDLERGDPPIVPILTVFVSPDGAILQGRNSLIPGRVTDHCSSQENEFQLFLRSRK